ncbi:MAG: hypothetical protein ACR2K3_09990 [Nocardioides sp.]
MTLRTLVPLVACAALLAGCGSSTSSTADEQTHRMPDGTVMSGSAMPDSTMPGSAMTGMNMDASAHEPSETASMICGEEIRGAVGSTLEIGRAPVGLHSWDPGTKLFSCTYQLSGGDLRMSVHDAEGAAEGTAYYDHLRARLPGVKDIKGLENFGFPAFETPRGDVVFIKDHKTLWVDATRLARTGLPKGTSRTVVAYGVAAAVIACWTE